MRSLSLLLSALALSGSLVAAASPPAPASAPAPSTKAAGVVLLMRLDGPIGPASASYLERGLRHAAREGASLVVLEIDTPGGLDAAMRVIIEAILASPVPVATYVSPAGARAASAGTYILYASHVAAMSPATNLGAATPVLMGATPPPAAEPADDRTPSAASAPSASRAPAPPPRDALEAKRVNDAAAYLRGLAQLHGRNAEWGEQAVREATSLAAHEALARHVVDIVANDVQDLLRQVDGRTVRMADGRTAVLATSRAVVESFEPTWRDRLLAMIGDPNLAVLLMLVGFYGLVFEFSSPGAVAPGVMGGVCLLLGLFGLQTLPVSAAGMALMLLGLAFFAAEIFVPSYGALSLGGAAAFGFGAVMLLDRETSGIGVSPLFAAALVLAAAAAVLLLSAMTARVRRAVPASGPGAMMGAVGELVEACGTDGWARVRGELWRVRCSRVLLAHERVRVTRVDGLTLEVEGVS